MARSRGRDQKPLMTVSAAGGEAAGGAGRVHPKVPRCLERHDARLQDVADGVVDRRVPLRRRGGSGAAAGVRAQMYRIAGVHHCEGGMNRAKRRDSRE